MKRAQSPNKSLTIDGVDVRFVPYFRIHDSPDVGNFSSRRKWGENLVIHLYSTQVFSALLDLNMLFRDLRDLHKITCLFLRSLKK